MSLWVSVINGMAFGIAIGILENPFEVWWKGLISILILSVITVLTRDYELHKDKGGEVVVLRRHVAIIREWLKGCSNTMGRLPFRCKECTMAMLRALFHRKVENVVNHVNINALSKEQAIKLGKEIVEAYKFQKRKGAIMHETRIYIKEVENGYLVEDNSVSPGKKYIASNHGEVVNLVFKILEGGI